MAYNIQESESGVENIVVEDNILPLDLLLEKVYRGGGYDFRDYKRGTVNRRLARRLHVTGVMTYPEYMEFLDNHPEEYKRLADELTIKVSGFFRSPHTFQQVARLVLPELLSGKEARREGRLQFWSTACARGEEPYSIAILLAEFLRQRPQSIDISINATDISQWALGKAQAGIYSLKDTEGLSPTVLPEYFIQHDQCYEVRADIRDMVSFSHFDLTSTGRAPFQGLDCVFCCNVLIYLQKQLQERVLGMLYDSLATPGYLILGEVETPPSEIREKLECLDSRAKIYKKVA